MPLSPSLRLPRRDAVLNALQQAGIGVGIHYPVPVHLQKAYAALGYRAGDFPVTERLAREFLSLPIDPEPEREGHMAFSSSSAFPSDQAPGAADNGMLVIVVTLPALSSLGGWPNHG